MKVSSSCKDIWHHICAWYVCMSISVPYLGWLQRLMLLKLAWCRATTCRSPVLQNQAAWKAPHHCSVTRLQELEKSRALAVTRILENQVISLLRSVIVLHWRRPSPSYKNHYYILLLYLKVHCLLLHWKQEMLRIIWFISQEVNDNNIPEKQKCAG